MKIEDNPFFSHWCVVCGKPVGKSRTSKAQRGECMSYGNAKMCKYDHQVSRGTVPGSAKRKGLNQKTVVPMSERQRIKHDNNVLGLQHYMEQRRERLARKCRVSM